MGRIRCGGVVLCGGKSRRMGREKASLPFGDETMLARVTRLLAEVVDPIVVVTAPNQPPVEVPVRATFVRDRVEDHGPLEGLAVGMGAVAGEADAVYVTGCDVPLLAPAFVEHLVRLLGEHQVAVPRDKKYFHPLAAVYRVSVLPKIEELLRHDRRRPVFLFDEVDTLAVPTETLKSVDPPLLSLLNLNSPDDYRKALQIAGLELSKENFEDLFVDDSTGA